MKVEYTQGFGQTTACLTTHERSILKANSAAVEMLPTQAPVHVLQYPSNIDAAEK